MIQEHSSARPLTASRYRPTVVGLLLAMLVLIPAAGVKAETLLEAVTRAFQSNPLLNAQRANVFATSENIPRARAGFLPHVEGTVEAGYRHEEGTEGGAVDRPFERTLKPRTYGVQVVQTLLDGKRTAYSVGQAEAQDLAARETLRLAEQMTILAAARAYVDVYANRATLDHTRRYVDALTARIDEVRRLRLFGEAIGTEVAEAEARLAGARGQQSGAQAGLQASLATYAQTIGSEPKQLELPRPVDQLLPPTREAALQTAMAQHPAVLAANLDVDAARLQIRIIEAEFYPTVSLIGAAIEHLDENLPGDERFETSILTRMRVPIYQGGEVAARTRQAAHTATQRRFDADSIRDQVRAAVITAWAQLEDAKARIQATRNQVQSAQTALEGARSLYRIEARNNIDVLNAEQDLLTAHLNQTTAQRDRVLASFAVAQAAGTLEFCALADGDGGPATERLAAVEAAVEDAHFKTTVNYANDGACPKCHSPSSALSLRPTLGD
jgi:outer membrane protein